MPPKRLAERIVCVVNAEVAPPERRFAGAVWIFGGAYGNLEALRGFFAQADSARADLVFTGDIAAYCADGEAAAALLREKIGDGIAVRGNCEAALAAEAADCGCGFAADSACAAMSGRWFGHARATVSAAHKKWMGDLPARAYFALGKKRFCVLHAAADSDNQFIFASTPAAEKIETLRAANADAVICGHSGIPFTEFIRVGGELKMWHNAGALGMPANDGTARVWFSRLTPEQGGIRISHRALVYEASPTRAKMRAAALPAGYADALVSGLWPSESMLPAAEKARRGAALAERDFFWRE